MGGLILLHENDYLQLKEQIIASQPIAEKQAKLRGFFDELMQGVEKNLTRRTRTASPGISTISRSPSGPSSEREIRSTDYYYSREQCSRSCLVQKEEEYSHRGVGRAKHNLYRVG